MPTDAEIMSRLAALGHGLPPPATPVGEFILWRREGDLVFLAGQICEEGGSPFPTASTARTSTLRRRVAAACSAVSRCWRTCARRSTATWPGAAGGDGARLRDLRAGFGDYPKVINACSELFIALWGEAGRHARTSIGVAQLPMNATVEIDAVFAVA